MNEKRKPGPVSAPEMEAWGRAQRREILLRMCLATKLRDRLQKRVKLRRSIRAIRVVFGRERKRGVGRDHRLGSCPRRGLDRPLSNS